MTALCTRFAKYQPALLMLSGLALFLTGCAASGKKPVAQRGWVGGEYRLAEKPRFFGAKGAINAFPAPLTNDRQKTGILVTALSSNTPAALAGLREGDLILEINRQSVHRLKDFRRTIDHTAPGTPLPFKIYREGRTEEYRVPVGRETYRHHGWFAIGLFAFPHPLDLVPNPDFSLIAAGFKRNQNRTELNSVESIYRQSCDPKNYEAAEEEWHAWLVIMQVSTYKRILSQETVVPPMAWPTIALRE